MSSFSFREPRLDDLVELRSLINAQESAIDPNHKPVPEAWPRELIEGGFDTPANRLWCDETGAIVAWATLQPDAHRRRIEAEVFRQPGFEHTSDVWLWSRETADRDFPGWDLWPAVNQRDVEMVEILESTGFSLLRRYYVLSRPLGGATYPDLPPGVTISVMDGEADLRAWHSAHQDAFSRHFGFTTRPYEEWIDPILRYDAADPEGRFLLRVDDEVAGYVVCTNDNAGVSEGYVQLLGVCHRFQGRGLGEALLRWAFAYCEARGFRSVDLSVDTDNSSGALALYEKVGFSATSEFHLYARGESAR